MPVQDKQIGPHVEFQLAGMRGKLVEHYGPSSYDATNKEVLSAKTYSMTGFALVEPWGDLVTDSSGAWFGFVRVIKNLNGAGVPTVQLRYYDTAGTEIANGVDLSGKRICLFILGI